MQGQVRATSRGLKDPHSPAPEVSGGDNTASTKLRPKQGKMWPTSFKQKQIFSFFKNIFKE